ncbi:MAG: TonB-dependent receptor [Bryobacteraceae bacterium]
MPVFFLYFALLFSVRGVVLDPSARPIEGARVSCGSAETNTDTEGLFHLDNAPDGCTLTIAKRGFLGVTQPAKDAEIHVEMALAPQSERVIVSATRSPILLEESGVSATVVTEQELANRQFPMVADVLREVPGLSVIRTNRAGGQTSLFTRGGSSNSTLVLLDGIPLTDPGGQIDLGHIQSTGLERIEAVRGPGSVVCGAEASAGVIQLFSKCGDAEAKIPHGFVSYERGSFQTDRWSAGLDGGLLGRLDYALSAEQFHTVSEFQNDFYRNTTGTANVGFRLTEATRLRAVFREFDANVGVPNQVAFGLFDNDAHSTSRDSAFSLKLDDARGRRFLQRAMFNYHRLANSFIDQNIDGPYTIAGLVRTVLTPRPYVYLVALVDPAKTLTAPPGLRLVNQTTSLYPFGGEFFTRRASFDYQGTFTHRGGSLTGGYRFEDQGGIISNLNVSRRNNGAFLHEQYAITPRLYLTAGARVEHSTTFGTRFVPRASLSYHALGEHGPLSSTWLHVNAGRGFTEPTLLENFARESFYVGNPLLRPEKTASYEAGIAQEWLGRRIRADVTYFRNSFTDLIAFISGAPSTFTNIERSWGRGLETTVKARVHRYVSLAGSYTLLYTRVTQSSSPRSNITGDGYELVRRPRNSGAVSMTVAGKRWVVVGGARFIGERQDADFYFGANRNPGYTSAYGNASWQVTKHFAPFLRVENLANERYQEVLGYSSLARQFLGGVRVSW